MEKQEFIVKAKEMGMSDSSIHEFLEYYAQLEKEGKAYPLEDFFESALSPDEVDIFCAGVPFSEQTP
jgi:hypothetical protein